MDLGGQVIKWVCEIPRNTLRASFPKSLYLARIAIILII
jgi:hypothetical protein